MKRSKHTARKGFTLVEMLIVLAILVGLAALVVPRLLGTQKKSDINLAKTQIGSLRGCLQTYYLDMKRFPSSEEGLSALVTATAGNEQSDASAASSWAGPYTETGELPVDPWGNEYQYEYPASHGKADFPDIWSWGPDGQDNTEDDVCNWTRDAEERGAGGQYDQGQGTAE